MDNVKIKQVCEQMLKNLQIDNKHIHYLDLFYKLSVKVHTYSRNMPQIKALGLERLIVVSGAFVIRIGQNYHVFFDDTKTDEEIRFALAHELGHIMCGHLLESSQSIISNEQKEKQANAFAHYLLEMIDIILHR